MSQAEEQKLRQYLLGQLTEAEEEKIELRLLTEPDFVEEYDIIVDEIIDDFIGGKFEGADLKQVEEYFFNSDDRRKKLKFALALQRRNLESGNKSLIKPLLIAACLLMVVGGIYIWRVYSRNAEVNVGLAELEAAYRNERPFPSRISGFDYAPFIATRGPGESDNIDQESLRLAEFRLLEAKKRNGTPTTRYALGKVYLAKGEFDRAIKEFDAAIKGDPNNAQLYSDLGASWLEKGRRDVDGKERGKGLEELARSFDSLSKAIELNGNLLEARFNRALCYQLQLLPQAEAEWREYLKRDPNSRWSEEARGNLNKLEEQKNRLSVSRASLLQNFLDAFERSDDQSAWLILSQHRDLTGGPITNDLIDRYLDLANLGQREQAAANFKALRYVAELEQERAGDFFVRDLTRFLKASSEMQRRSLAEGRRLLKAGQDYLMKQQGKLAEEQLTRAKAVFEQTGDTAEAIYTDYPIGHAHLLQFQSQLSLTVFTELVRKCEAVRYRWLQAQALNATANNQIGLTNLSAALEASNQSLKLSEEIGDTTGIMKTTNQLAQQYFRLGNYVKSLELHQKSLAMAFESGTEPIQFWRTYFTIAFPLNAMGLNAAAIEYEKEALRWAEQSNQPPTTVCRVYSFLGLMYAGQGNYNEALKNANVAMDRARQLADKTTQKEAIAYTSLHRAFVYRQSGDLAKAVADYDQSIKLYDELGKFQAFLYAAQKGKLLACLEQGCGSVQEQIRLCLNLFEKYRSTIREESNREPFFDMEQDIYDIAIDYEFSRKDFETAFEYSDHARGRSLLDLTNKTTTPLDQLEPDIRYDSPTPTENFAELKASIPTGTQVLEYSVLKDKLVIWLISNTDFAHEEKVISRSDFDEAVLRFVTLVSNPSTDIETLRREGSALYDTLIKPMVPFLKKDLLLCLVPDKNLNYLPFAALISSTSGQYLMSEYRLTSAPSVAMFASSSEFATARDKAGAERLLVVGNPRFSRENFPQLADLPDAEREAREIRHAYESTQPRMLIGAQATRSLVQSEMKQSAVIHLALHSIVDEQFPLRSRLVLTASDHNDSIENEVLQAYQIYQLDLPKTRLVVLSSCESGVGRYYGGEGVKALAGAFLAARVPLVIATLWRVDSDASADLMIDFHRLRTSEKLATVDALRQAQQHMAVGPEYRYRHPYYWAAFTVTGGYATF
jgi:CHAT domain-containing protein